MLNGSYTVTQFEADAGNIEAAKAIAEEHGFCLVRNVFSPVEVEKIKAGMKTTNEVFGEEFPDLLSCPELAWILFDPRITRLARGLLGERLVYYAESAINYEKEIGRYTLSPFAELHCDAMGMPGNLWTAWSSPTNEIYGAYRFGLYFHDYGTSSGALKVGVGSHRGDPMPIIKSGGLSSDLRVVPFRNGESLKVPAPNIPLYDVPAKPGDVVIWNLRTFHAAGAKRLRTAPEIALHPQVEKEVDQAFPDAFYPPPGPRLAVFFDYGAPVEGTDLYIKNRALGRAVRGLSPFTHSTHDSAENIEIARQNDVTVRFDYIIVALALALGRGTVADVNATAGRLLNLLVGYSQFSPHFPLFDSARFWQELRNDRGVAVRSVVHHICKRVGTLRR
jgi:hypothetical protein